MDAWLKMVDFSIIRLDYYQAIQRKDFLDQANVFPIEFTNELSIMEEDKISMVPKIWSTKQNLKRLQVFQVK